MKSHVEITRIGFCCFYVKHVLSSPISTFRNKVREASIVFFCCCYCFVFVFFARTFKLNKQSHSTYICLKSQVIQSSLYQSFLMVHPLCRFTCCPFRKLTIVKFNPWWGHKNSIASMFFHQMPSSKTQLFEPTCLNVDSIFQLLNKPWESGCQRVATLTVFVSHSNPTCWFACCCFANS